MARPQNSILLTAKRLALVTLGAALMAFNINTFVKAGELIPGGFTGLTVLIQKIGSEYFGIAVPFSLVLYALNIFPAVICFRAVGKKFTLYSILMVAVCGLLADCMPHMFIDFIQLHDTLLAAVFGGILNAVAILLCLYAGATSGGSDFIAIYISEKYKRDAWNYIFAGNCVILGVTACLFPLDKVLYSIIFQFTATIVLNSLYRAYQQKTLLIVTGRPDEVYALIRERTHHATTAITGKGLFNAQDRVILYSVVYSDEVAPLIKEIHAADPSAFINVIKTEQINGRFYKKPMD